MGSLSNTIIVGTVIFLWGACKKKNSSTLDGIDRFSSGASRFVPVSDFKRELTFGLSSFQLRDPVDLDSCFYPGTAKYEVCDGVSHFNLRPAGPDTYKFRFIPGPNELCLGDYDSLKLISCDEKDAELKVTKGASGSWLVGTKTSFAIYQPVNSPLELGIEASRGWEDQTFDKLPPPYWEYATRILQDPKSWSPVTYTEMAPPMAVSNVQPLRISKKVAWFRNNDAVCAGICAEHGKVCASQERQVLIRGSQKRVHAVCTNDYSYFSNRMNDETIRKLRSVSFFYAKGRSKTEQSLLRIVTKHELAFGETMTTSFGCSSNVDGCRINDVTTVEVNTSQGFSRLWLDSDHQPGHVGSILLEDLQGKVWRVNGSSTELQEATAPSQSFLPGELGNGPTLLDPKDFLSRDQRTLFNILGRASENDSIPYPDAKPYLSNFAMGSRELASLVDLEYGLAGFYGFSTGNKISSIGGVFIDRNRDDLQSVSAEGIIGHVKRASATVGQEVEQQNRWNRSFKDFGSVLETSYSLFGVIRGISFDHVDARYGDKNINALSNLTIHSDISQKNQQQYIDIGTTDQWDLNILGYTPDQLASNCPASSEECAQFRLCRVDVRLFPKVPKRAPMKNANDRFQKRYEPMLVANTGAIHSLKFTFAKRDEQGYFSGTHHSIIAGASEALIEDDYQVDPKAKEWQLAFPSQDKNSSQLSKGQCSETNPNEVTGFFGQLADEVEHDGLRNPQIISKLGFYFGIPLEIANLQEGK